MGRTHAATGAATWLVGCGIAATEGVNIGVHHVLLGAGLMAYGAVLPDIDMPRSNVALSLGWPTKVTAQLVAWFGAWLHARTRTSKDRVDKDGHRVITHWSGFCVMMTIAVGALGRYGGLVAPVVFVLVAVATASRALLKPENRRVRVRWKRLTGRGRHSVRVSRPVVFGTVAALMMVVWPPPSGWWLGIAVGGGCAIHCFGDMLTNQGVPFFFPWEIKGCRWYCIRVREEWRFETKQESRIELWIFRSCVAASVVAFGLVLAVAWPDMVSAVAGWGRQFAEGWARGDVS